MLAWSQYDLSKVAWYHNKSGMASTPALLYEVSLFQKSDIVLRKKQNALWCTLTQFQILHKAIDAKHIFVSNAQYLNYNEE